METLYPKGPQSVPENLTKPTSRYKLHAWLALGGLCTFVLLYFWLIYFFASTSLHSFQNLGKPGSSFMNLIIAVIMAFLTLFLAKAVFFIKRFDKVDDIEITAKEEPELFKFINEVADNAGAPRPHLVYLSPRVNASVFYDLSIINLIFPTKKNLEIGLGLVNSVTLNEFKAILAHEFGHFAQKTMAVGRWVYISRQIASHIVGTRDWFDKLIAGISSVDIRVAWIGWLLSIFVWAIRSLMDTLFTIVVLAERALSREMEFNADLVAVSLSGSDAIVNGLYKLEAADNAWDQSVQYGLDALYEGKSISDVFSLQKYFVKKIGVILDKPEYGNPPTIENSSSRIFKKHLASPPKMWSTHPSGFEREENAKRIYVAAPNDERSSWILFQNPDELKQKMTKHLYRNIDVKDKQIEGITNEQAISEIDKKYNKEFYDPKYRGFYLKYPLTRDVGSAEELYTNHLRSDYDINYNLKDLYPESLKSELELFESKSEEILMLQALYDKVYDAHGGVILHEGKEIKRKDLPAIIAKLKKEVKDQQNKFLQFNKNLRSLHFQIAEGFDSSWGSYLIGLTGLIHYAEHNIAVVIDHKRIFDNTLRVVVADGKVSNSEMSKLITDAGNITRALEGIYNNTSKVIPSTSVLARMNAESWSSLLEEFKLGYANTENINGWIGAVDSWINLAAHSLERLKDAALEELIITEANLVSAYLNSTKPGLAPIASEITYEYPVLVSGNESTIKLKLNLWDRFYAADGLIPSVARFSVAASIIGIALFAGHSTSKSDLIIYNGLSIPVNAKIADKDIRVEPLTHEKITLSSDESFHVEAKTEDGRLIEEFSTDTDNGADTYIYNIASAAVMQKWTIYYTSSFSNSDYEPKRQIIGASRWFVSNADYYFTEPPQNIKMSGSVETKSVLAALSEDPSATLSLAKDKEDSLNIIRTHILWDDGKSKNIISWLSMAGTIDDGESLLAARLKRNKNEMITLRSMQDYLPKDKAKKACEDCEERFSKDPENADLFYLAKRCMEEGPEQDKAFIEGYQKWPDNAWLSFAGGYALAAEENWTLAEKALRNAVEKEPSLSSACMDIARIYKINYNKTVENTWNSEALNYISQIESGSASDSVSAIYYKLFKGKLNEALEASEYNAQTHAFFLRLVAASDGASEDIIQLSLKLKPEEGINLYSLSSTIGLLARKGKDISPYLNILRIGMTRDANKFEAFINALRNGASTEKAEGLIKGLSIHTKGHAYALGAVYLDKKCPISWKRKANQLLFVTERPYFIDNSN